MWMQQFRHFNDSNGNSKRVPDWGTVIKWIWYRIQHLEAQRTDSQQHGSITRRTAPVSLCQVRQMEHNKASGYCSTEPITLQCFDRPWWRVQACLQCKRKRAYFVFCTSILPLVGVVMEQRKCKSRELKDVSRSTWVAQMSIVLQARFAQWPLISRKQRQKANMGAMSESRLLQFSFYSKLCAFTYRGQSIKLNWMYL